MGAGAGLPVGGDVQSGRQGRAAGGEAVQVQPKRFKLKVPGTKAPGAGAKRLVPPHARVSVSLS
jgi:hypothetical protein